MQSPRERDSPRAKGLVMGELGRERDRNFGRAKPSPRMRCGEGFVSGRGGFRPRLFAITIRIIATGISYGSTIAE